MLKNDINRFIRVCLDSALVAENSELDDVFLREIGLGKLVYARIMREGVRELIEIQSQKTDLQYKNEMLKDDVEIYNKIACVSDLDCLNDDVLKKIKNFIDEVVEKEFGDNE